VKHSCDSNSLIVIDYLQILDHKRSTPEVMSQLKQLKEFARLSGIRIIFISQVDRVIESKKEKRPEIGDIKVINRFDSNIFNKIVFLYFDPKDTSKAEVLFRAPKDYSFKINRDNTKAVFF